MSLKPLPRLPSVDPNAAAVRLRQSLPAPAGATAIIRSEDVEALLSALGRGAYSDAVLSVVDGAIRSSRLSGKRTVTLDPETVRALIAPLAEP